MEKIKDQYRQGDVLLERVDDSGIPPIEEMKVVERDRGRVVLAYGEVTGHAHSIASEQATLYAITGEAGKEEVDEAERVPGRFLRVLPGGLDDGAVALEHEQHPEIELPPAWYRVLRQSEYTPEAIRTVAD